MSISKFTNNEILNAEIKQELKADEYVFKVNGNKIFNVYLTYSIGDIESILYRDGKKVDNIIEPILYIELDGKDTDGNETWISFNLRIDMSYLNALSKIPTDLTSTLLEGDSFIKKPNEELSEFLDFELPKNNENDIYKEFSSLWVSKIDNGEFIFKLSVPNVLFTYFKLIVKNEEL